MAPKPTQSVPRSTTTGTRAAELKRKSGSSKPESKAASKSKGKPSGAKGETRSRTFTGCGTCRSRHLKCDEARPICTPCRRLNMPCQGYAPRFLWVAEQTDDPERRQSHRASSFRYPLFTEAARNVMSQDMVDSLLDKSAGDILMDLDNETVNQEQFHSRGPFGVFRAYDDPTELDPEVSPDSPVQKQREVAATSSPQQASDSDSAVDFSTFPGEEDVEEIPTTHWPQNHQHHHHHHADQPIDPALMHPDFATSSFTADIADLDSWLQLGFNPSNDQVHSFPFDNCFNTSLIVSPPRSPRGLLAHPHPALLQQITSTETQRERRKTPTMESAMISQAESQPSSQPLASIPPTLDLTLSGGGTPTLPPHAALLLRHLKTTVLEDPSTTHSPRTSPWKVLLLPCALEAFAEMSLWNTTSNTRRSILCTLLAKSAYHLHQSLDAVGDQAAPQWLQVAMDHQHDSQEYLKMALKTEIDGDAQSNYTEMLMAILGAGVVSVHFNGARAVKKLLLDAERLIRLRGLPSSKSFGLRVLHHMYTHLRVIMESTNIFATPVANEAWDPSNSHSVDAVSGQMGLRRFRVHESSLGDLDLMRPKGDDVGYNDIHLEISGFWHATMYPEIYGIPESLMTLLSQTISLANEKPKLEVDAITNPAIAVALSGHIKTLEQQVWSWSMQSSSGGAASIAAAEPLSSSNNASTTDRPLTESLILAMHQALIVYFYRRVYNMSAMIIQDQVKKTLDFIQPCIGMGANDQDFAISIGWSIFIASCEAATPALQKQGLECLEAVDGHGMFIVSDKPSVVAKAVWEQREASGDMTLSWPNLIVQA